jgi:hypothetical protein
MFLQQKKMNKEGGFLAKEIFFSFESFELLQIIILIMSSFYSYYL